MTAAGQRSAELWEAARQVIPGGVNSPVRAFKSVGGEPVFIESASGCRLLSVDGREYVDYVMSWGPLILGHAHPRVVEAAREACARGTSFGMPTEVENRLAAALVELFPGMDKVRMVSSGTEAAMSAVRLARGATGRDLVVKFEGCYHGHSDGLLAAAGSGVLTFGIPGTPGVPAGCADKTLVLPFNDRGAVEEACSRWGAEIAAVIVEPVAGNMGVVPPADGYLRFLREITGEHGIVFIFDEVITGLRLGLSGAQGLYGVRPDITVLGKIVGGGLPVGAYGGRAELMDQLAPAGAVYQAGTLSGNPVAMAAGLATVQLLVEDPPYERLEASATRLQEGLRRAAERAGVPVQQNRVGSMQTLFFTEEPVTDYRTAKSAEAERYARFFRGMLERGVHLPPSQFEACFVSTAHSDEDIDKTVEAARQVLGALP